MLSVFAPTAIYRAIITFPPLVLHGDSRRIFTVVGRIGGWILPRAARRDGPRARTLDPSKGQTASRPKQTPRAGLARCIMQPDVTARCGSFHLVFPSGSSSSSGSSVTSRCSRCEIASARLYNSRSICMHFNSTLYACRTGTAICLEIA